MTEQPFLSVEDGIARVVLGKGPAPVLSPDLIADLAAALDQVETDDTVKIVTLQGQGRAFPAGVDDTIHAGSDDHLTLGALCLRLENFPKPVLAVLHGSVIGGGAELALAAHYRIAHVDSRIGFPQVRVGTIPSAGATQRIPRLGGAQLACDLLLSGRLMPLATGPAETLIDDVFDGTPEEAGDAYARKLLAQGAPPRPTANIRSGFADAVAYQSIINRQRAALAESREVAPRHILDAIEAAVLLPMPAGLAFEEAAQEDFTASTQSAALRHIFDAEQAASVNTRRTDLPTIDRVAVLGGGPIAVQIVVCALDAGMTVHWGTRQPEPLRDGVARVRELIHNAVTQGTLSAEKAAQCLKSLRQGDSADMVRDVDIVLRAARGQRGVAIPIGTPAATCMQSADTGLSLRFAAPASSTRLVEVVQGPEAEDDDVHAGLALCRRLRKVAVIEHGSGGCVLDHLVEACLRAADSLIDLGQSPYDIDTAMKDWGMAHPPYILADLSGTEKVSHAHRGEGAQNWSGTMMRLGRPGRSGGLGFYDYDETGAPRADPAVTARLDERRKAARPMPPGKIAMLIVGAMANEGARCLRSGLVRHAAEVDLVSVLSGLVPRWRGGVMHAAGAAGLLQTSRALERLGHPDRDFWTPDPSFAELIKYGRTFDAL